MEANICLDKGGEQNTLSNLISSCWRLIKVVVRKGGLEIYKAEVSLLSCFKEAAEPSS